MHIEVVVFDGVEELDALAPYAVLRKAAEAGADLRVALVTLEGAEEVTGSSGVRIRPDGRLGARERPDLVVVPGGGWVARAARGVRAEAERGDLPRALAALHADGTILAAVCTGTMLLAAARLLDGRPATTHHGALADLQASGAEVIPARVVDDGDIVTAGGVTSGLDLALWLVERFAGSQVASAVEQRLEYERRGTVWRRPVAASRLDHPASIATE
jgi:transcriptional regulator GlxA family with amidase domain